MENHFKLMYSIKLFLFPIKMSEESEIYTLYLMYNPIFNYIKVGMCRGVDTKKRQSAHSRTLTKKIDHIIRAASIPKVMNILLERHIITTESGICNLENIIIDAFGKLYRLADMNDNGTNSRE